MKTLMNTLRVMAFAVVISVSLTILSGCGGGGATFHTTGDKTLGQELQDLQASYDKGILTKKEYEDTKKKVIRKYTK